jgi:hypothetical protein
MTTTRRVTVDGRSPSGDDRVLDLEPLGDGSHDVRLHIHSPGKDNGWSIEVDPLELIERLAKCAREAHSPSEESGC